MALGAILGAAGGILGAIGGAQGSQQNQTVRRELAPASAGETRGGELALQNLNDLQGLLGQGPGAQDVAAGVGAQRSLADLLKQLQESGGLPGAQDVQAAQSFAGQVFQGQQNSLTNAFEDQRVQASRAQARLGRGGFDPVLQNKLAQEQTRQQGQLAADQGSFAAQFAQQLPQQRLGFAQQYAGVQSGLASQAMANRQALFNLGSQLQNQGQQFRLGSATTTSSQSQPGGFLGALTGGIAGASQGFAGGNNLSSAFSNMFSGGSSPATGVAASGTQAAPINNFRGAQQISGF